MNGTVVIGLGLLWAVAIALGALWFWYAQGRGAQMLQVLLVAVLPLLIALLVSNRLVPLARAKSPVAGGKAQPRQLKPASAPGRPKSSRAQGGFAFLGRKRAAPAKESGKRSPCLREQLSRPGSLQRSQRRPQRLRRPRTPRPTPPPE